MQIDGWTTTVATSKPVADASPFVPETENLTELAAAAGGCEGCELYADATQTVFGRGPAAARLVLVGEQPGDVEDQQGKPFVGPAGQLLVRALRSAAIDPSSAYVTNAVKHFRWQPAERGPRRIHAKPGAKHIRACRPWLSAELRAVSPRLVIALGATAAQSLMGNDFKVTQQRGQLIASGEGDREWQFLATIHPSAVLRAQDRDAAFDGLVSDLRIAAELIAGWA